MLRKVKCVAPGAGGSARNVPCSASKGRWAAREAPWSDSFVRPEGRIAPWSGRAAGCVGRIARSFGSDAGPGGTTAKSVGRRAQWVVRGVGALRMWSGAVRTKRGLVPSHVRARRKRWLPVRGKSRAAVRKAGRYRREAVREHCTPRAGPGSPALDGHQGVERRRKKGHCEARVRVPGGGAGEARALLEGGRVRRGSGTAREEELFGAKDGALRPAESRSV